jgi:hypothetical protein
LVEQGEEQRDRVYFLAKDPLWTFVWWELTEASLSRAAHRAGSGGQLTLRLDEVAAIGSPAACRPAVLDVPIVGVTDHWYLSVPASGRTYQVQLGCKSPAGEFYPIAASNRLRVPPAGPSDRWDECWSTVMPRGRRWRRRAFS